MAYVKNTWVDQKVQRPKTYNFTNNDDGSTTLIDAFVNVEELGTPVNADNMNHIEDGLANVGIWTYSATVEYNKDDAVIGIVDDEFVLYKSKQDKNKGNALIDADYWEEVKLNSELFNGKVDLNASNLNAQGRNYVSGLGMPSNKYIDLTLGASGTTYTAPANGYYWIEKSSSANNQYVDCIVKDSNNTYKFTVSIYYDSAGTTQRILVPVLKNDKLTVSYTAGRATNYFRFIYAEGENN